MTTAEMAEFLLRTGRRVVEVDGVFWYSQGRWAMAHLPDHAPASPTPSAIARVARAGRALVVRYVAEGEPTPGRGLFVCSDRDYGLGALHPKARSQTRSGLVRCTVEQIAPSLLAEAGYPLNEDTWKRQGRSPRCMSRNAWARMCSAATGASGVEAWAAFVGRDLAAFMLCALVEGCYTILYQSSATRFLGDHPNNALAYTVARAALDRRDVDFVSYGLRSVEPTPGLDRFKERMGFHLRPHRELLVAGPIARGFLSYGGASLAARLAARFPASDFCRKAASIARLLTA
jgi:hypothetical protein